jgi:hypothetical protein
MPARKVRARVLRFADNKCYGDSRAADITMNDLRLALNQGNRRRLLQTELQ